MISFQVLSPVFPIYDILHQYMMVPWVRGQSKRGSIWSFSTLARAAADVATSGIAQGDVEGFIQTVELDILIINMIVQLAVLKAESWSS